MVATGLTKDSRTIRVEVTSTDPDTGASVTEVCEGYPATVAAFMRSVAERVSPLPKMNLTRNGF